MLRRTPNADATGIDELDFHLIDALVVPASVHALDGRYLHLNPAGEAASGFSDGELRGRHFKELVPRELHAYVEAHFATALKGETVDFETSFVDGNGRLVATRTHFVPLFSAGSVIGVVIFAYDTRADGSLVPSAPAKLTPRQREILRLMAGAVPTTEIADTLGISYDTVRNHIRDLLAALDAHSRLEAVVKAERSGLLPMTPLSSTTAKTHPVAD